MKKQSKASQIIDLLATTDLTRTEIAAQVGCLPEYVRVVGQRLLAEPGNSPEQRWAKRNIDRHRKFKREYQRWKLAVDPEYAERQRISHRNSARRRRARQAESGT